MSSGLSRRSTDHLMDLAGRTTIAGAVGVMHWLAKGHFNFLPLGSEGEAVAFAIAGGFAGAGIENAPLPRYIRWIEEKLCPRPLLSYLLFVFFFGVYLLCWAYITTPPYWFVIVESAMYGLAFLFLFWCIATAGGKLIDPRQSGGENSSSD